MKGEKNREWQKILALSLCLIIWLGGCAGGGDDTASGNGQEGHKFNSSGIIGDMLTYDIDTDNMTYSYEIISSAFGLEGTTGSGSLTQNADGTYSPSNDPDTRMILLPNTLIVGQSEITVQGSQTTMLFAGVPALTTNYTPSEIAGSYNYITYICNEALSGGICTAGYYSHFGTFRVEAGGTWESCDIGDIDDQSNHPCGSTDGGTWSDLGNGLIEIRSGGNVMGNSMLLPSSGGGKIIIVDFQDRPGINGPGVLIGVKRQDVNGVDIGGTYYFNKSDGEYGHMTVDNGTDSYSGTTYDVNGNPTSFSGNVTRNTPWPGWMMDQDNGFFILILPSDGVFFNTQQEPDNDWIVAGGEIP
jgi:hypothetical protein